MAVKKMYKMEELPSRSEGLSGEVRLYASLIKFLSEKLEEAEQSGVDSIFINEAVQGDNQERESQEVGYSLQEASGKINKLCRLMSSKIGDLARINVSIQRTDIVVGGFPHSIAVKDEVKVIYAGLEKDMGIEVSPRGRAG